jgi:hypothetical protein
MGINYGATLGKVHQLFPTAKIEKMSTAWAQKSDALYSIKGDGISGTIVVKFTDLRAINKEIFERSNPGPDRDKMEIEINKNDMDALWVEWVRWVPPLPIPLKRLVDKYGPWDKKEIHSQTFESQRTWTKRRISAHLTDDDKSVQMIDFNFTGAEKIMGCRLAGEALTPLELKSFKDEDEVAAKATKTKKGK